MERAARAAGLMLEESIYPGWFMCDGRQWNALVDDGDALRLAISLGINLEIGEVGFGDVQAGKRDHWACEWLNGDNPCAATRRAIVRAAAEIGKTVGAPHEAGN